MLNYEQILTRLRELGDPAKVEFKAKKFGIYTKNALGVYMKDLNELIKQIPKNEALANRLFDSQVYEARLICSKIYPPKLLTSEHMDSWVVTFDNWEICDSFGMKLFARSPHAVSKIHEWYTREPEFEKRVAFTIMATYCMADKKANNQVYLDFLPLIIQASADDRNFVKKAVNWALRSIGKRNQDLNKAAIATAYEILKSSSKTAKWIAKDALRELQSPKANILDYPRAIYRS